MSGNGIKKPNSNSLPLGYRFNEFEIKEVIGEGGFGIVYRAYDHQLERTIAIKEYMPTQLAKRNDDLTLSLRGERFSKTFQAGLNSFIQEARLLAASLTRGCCTCCASGKRTARPTWAPSSTAAPR
ncbi:Uncharacterised protein [Serratia rubidaea]|uniref:Protein kinase domain-containing protein n=1 Tax=Serratia rubidaea TaxID=61652 RepID=A0A4U9HJQ2_SERRU|nr:Uncharacterised protein [Serratia rubidaea]